MSSTADARGASRRGPGRPPSGSEDKRERILSEAVTLFAERGYAGTSIADIAAASDISKAGLLHHFSSKDELFAQVLMRRDEESARQFLSETQDDPWLYLEAFVRLVEHNTRHRDLVALYTATAVSILNAEHPAHTWFARHLSNAVEELENLFEVGKECGTVAPDAPSRLMARTIVALSDGLQMQWLCATTPRTRATEALDTNLVAEIRMVIDAFEQRWRIQSQD